MGIGAVAGIVGAVGALASAGSSIYGATQQGGGGQVNALATQEGHAINLARQKYLDQFLNPNFWNLNIPGMMGQQQMYGQQYAAQENLFNQQQLTNMLNQLVPGGIKQFGANVASELQGNVPIDVQNQIQRFGAQQAITSGIGAGGGAGFGSEAGILQGRNITARDLGLTSLNLMQLGQSGLGFARNYLMPQLATPQTMLPLSTLLAGEQWTDQAIYEANLAAYNSRVASEVASTTGMVPTQSQGAGLGSAIGGGLQALGQINPQTGQSPISQLLGLFGGGGQQGSGVVDQFIGGMGLGGAGGAANWGY